MARNFSDYFGNLLGIGAPSVPAQIAQQGQAFANVQAGREASAPPPVWSPGNGSVNQWRAQQAAAQQAAAQQAQQQIQQGQQQSQTMIDQLGQAGNAMPMPLGVIPGGIQDWLNQEILRPGNLHPGAPIFTQGKNKDETAYRGSGAAFLVNLLGTPKYTQNVLGGDTQKPSDILASSIAGASRVYSPETVHAALGYAAQNPEQKTKSDYFTGLGNDLVNPKSETNLFTGKKETQPAPDTGGLFNFGSNPINPNANSVYKDVANTLIDQTYGGKGDPNAVIDTKALAGTISEGAKTNPEFARVGEYLTKYAEGHPSAKISDVIQDLQTKGQSPATYKDLAQSLKSNQLNQKQLDQQTYDYAVKRGAAITQNLQKAPNLDEAVKQADIQVSAPDAVKTNFRLSQEGGRNLQFQSIQQQNQANSFVNTVIKPLGNFVGGAFTGAGTIAGNLLGGNIAARGVGKQARDLYAKADDLTRQSQDALQSGDKQKSRTLSRQADVARAGADSYLKSAEELHSGVGRNVAAGGLVAATILGAKGLGGLAKGIPTALPTAAEGIGGANQSLLGALRNITQATTKVAGGGAAANTVLTGLGNVAENRPVTQGLPAAAVQGAALSLPFLPLGLRGAPYVDRVSPTNLLDGTSMRGEAMPTALPVGRPGIMGLDRESIPPEAASPEAYGKMAVPVGETTTNPTSVETTRGDILARKAYGTPGAAFMPFDTQTLPGAKDLNIMGLQNAHNPQQARENYQAVQTIVDQNRKVVQALADKVVKNQAQSDNLVQAIRDPENIDRYAAEHSSDPAKQEQFKQLVQEDRKFKDFLFYVDHMTGGTTRYAQNYHPDFYEGQVNGVNETAVRTHPEQPFFSRSKTFQTPQEATDAGFTRKTQTYQKDLQDLTSAASDFSAGRTLKNSLRSFAPDQVNEMVPGGGRLPVGQVINNVRGLRDFEVSPQLHEELKGIFSQTSKSKPVQALDKSTQFLKKVLFFGTPFHAITESFGHAGREVMSGRMPRIDQGVASFFSPNFHYNYLRQARDSGLLNRAVNANVILSRSADVEGTGAIQRTGRVSKTANAIHDATFDRLINFYKLESFKSLEKSGKIDMATPEGLVQARRLGNQINALYGGLNYTALNRSRGIQQVLRNLILAPDFNEGKVRTLTAALSRNDASGAYARQALIGKTMALAISAALVNRVAGNQFDPSLKGVVNAIIDPEIHVGKSKFKLPSSIPGDLTHLLSNPGRFVQGRLSGTAGLAERLISGKDVFGRPNTAGDIAKSALPLPLQAITNLATGKADPLTAALNLGGLHANVGTDQKKLSDLNARLGDIGKQWETVGLPSPQTSLTDSQKALLSKFVTKDGALMTSGKTFDSILNSLNPAEREQTLNALRQVGTASDLPKSASTLIEVAKELQKNGDLVQASPKLQEALKGLVSQRYDPEAARLYGMSQAEQEQALATLRDNRGDWQTIRNQAEQLRRDLVQFGYPGAESKTIADQPNLTTTEEAKRQFDTARDFATRDQSTEVKNLASASAPIQQLALNINPNLANQVNAVNAYQQMLINAGVKSPYTKAFGLQPGGNLYKGKGKSRFGISPNDILSGKASLPTKGGSGGGRGGGRRGKGGGRGRSAGKVMKAKGGAKSTSPPRILGLPRMNPGRVAPLDQALQNLQQIRGSSSPTDIMNVLQPKRVLKPVNPLETLFGKRKKARV